MNNAQLKYWRLACSELGDVLACLQRACQLPLIHDVSGCALKFLCAGGAVVIPDKNIKSTLRQELVQAVVKDVPLCITSSSVGILPQIIAAANGISNNLLDSIKSGMISCNPQLASLILPLSLGKPEASRWENILNEIVHTANDEGKDGMSPYLPGRCFRSCVSFTMLIIVTCPPTSKAIEPRDAAVALECIG
jgi:hypothetical protein